MAETESVMDDSKGRPFYTRVENALELIPPNACTFEYTCTIPGHESMTGTLDVG